MEAIPLTSRLTWERFLSHHTISIVVDKVYIITLGNSSHTLAKHPSGIILTLDSHLTGKSIEIATFSLPAVHSQAII
jgi:ethanolamine utilization microcompartment shell protein EutL